jgi:hypothetical protein
MSKQPDLNVMRREGAVVPYRLATAFNQLGVATSPKGGNRVKPGRLTWP